MLALLRGMLKGPVIAWMHQSGCTRGDHADTIPVYAVIPEGERPQTTWDEPEVSTEYVTAQTPLKGDNGITVTTGTNLRGNVARQPLAFANIGGAAH